MDVLQDLDINLRKKIKKNIVLAPYTTFKIGGPAKYFFETDNEKELVEILKFCKEKKIPYFVLGGGSNILVSDKGFKGIVIKIKNQKLKIKNNLVNVGAGALISNLILKTKKHNLSGLEYLTGLPGTLGGAIFGNAGSRRFGKEIGDLVKKAKLLFPDGKIKEVNNVWFKFSYRHSHLKDFKDNERPIVLSATLKLKHDTKKNIEKRMNEINTIRTKNLPKGFCAGCVFKNVEIDNLTKNEKNTIAKLIPLNIIKGNKTKKQKIPTAWLIDQCGLKGKRIGGAKISEQHANFIINEGKASASDVKKLMDLARKKVFKKFNIHLKDENILVGF